ncbi:MAG: hypothetical protein JO099_25110, partial [Acidobacteriia bacterium]|nr:hypothetical protein [Terriglobia bacterium]
MWRIFRHWFRRDREDAELAEELRIHIAMETRERIQSGENPEQAAFSARRNFGNLARIYEQTRESWGWQPLERFL